MFTDSRSKSILFVAHCILNQNAVSDGSATYPGAIREVMKLLYTADIGIVQMPCPELMCLGLDRGNAGGGTLPVIEENTRIRKAISQKPATDTMKKLVESIVCQIAEYVKHGFDIRGIVGINRSPSCGVDTTSENNQEVEGKGVFIEALLKALKKNGITINFAGIKTFEPEEMVTSVKRLIERK